jgi:hypothetical protein|tara:strand:+ start:201 stop:509 length:309 start_codon:yes stop_codon:yes gene_type:complete
MITVKQAKQTAQLKGAWSKTAEISFYFKNTEGVWPSFTGNWVTIAEFIPEAAGGLPAYFLYRESVVEISHQEYAALLDNYTKQHIASSRLNYWEGVDTSAIR